MGFRTTLGLVLLSLSVPLTGQQPAQPSAIPPVSAAQRFFEAGQYPQALQAIAAARQTGATGPHEAFLAAHAYLRQEQVGRAKEEFGRLAPLEDRMWQLVGQSSIALADQQVVQALKLGVAATAVIEARNAAPVGAPPMTAAPTPGEPAVPADPGIRRHDFHAYYQLGLVKARQQDWAGSAAAFERASQLNPAFAYAHYYAGMAYSRVQRGARVVSHLELFVKLAPTAPERNAVVALLRTMRGGS